MEIKNINNQFEQIVISAIRYALPRKTYITGVTSDFVIDNIHLLSNKAINVIKRDINQAFIDYEMDSCDKECWIKLLNELNKGE